MATATTGTALSTASTDAQPPDLASQWESQYGRFQGSRRRIATARRWARNDEMPHIPQGWENPAAFQVIVPQGETMGQDVASFVARKQPSPKRTPLGAAGPRANAVASAIEAWLQAAIFSAITIDGEPLWEALSAYATNDGEFAVLVQPRPSSWGSLLSFEDNAGQVRVQWQRNAQGLAPDEFKTQNPRGAYRPSKRRSKVAWNEYVRDFKARRFPFVVRLLPADQCLPVGRDPLTGRVDALLVRTERAAVSLRREGFSFVAVGEGHAANAQRVGETDTFVLYEQWTAGESGARVEYQITGLQGQRYQTTKDGQATAVVDLAALYGIAEVPGGYYYGWHRAHETPEHKGIPLLEPFIGLLKGANQTASAKAAHLFNTGFGGWGIEMDKELYQAWVELGRPTTFDLTPMKMHLLLGKPHDLVHAGSGGEANEYLQMLIGLIDRFSEQQAIKGSPDTSGIAQAVSGASVDTVLNQISTGARLALQRICECLLEQVACLSEQTGEPVPVYAYTDAQGQHQDHVELSASDLGGDFSVTIEFPEKRGSNIPKAQAGVAWKESGLISQREWREDFYGDPQPEQAMDEIALERYLARQDIDDQVVELAQMIRGERNDALKARLQQQGKLSPGGLPSAAIPPRPDQQPVQAPPPNGIEPNGVPSTQNVNRAASALGGQMAGVMQTGAQARIMQATGQPAETAPR